MAEYRHNAAVVGGGILATVGAAVIIGWWTITATVASAPGFWQLWLLAPAFVVIVGSLLILGVALDWFPSLGAPRAKARGKAWGGEPSLGLQLDSLRGDDGKLHLPAEEPRGVADPDDLAMTVVTPSVEVKAKHLKTPMLKVEVGQIWDSWVHVDVTNEGDPGEFGMVQTIESGGSSFDGQRDPLRWQIGRYGGRIEDTLLLPRGGYAQTEGIQIPPPFGLQRGTSAEWSIRFTSADFEPLTVAFTSRSTRLAVLEVRLRDDPWPPKSSAWFQTVGHIRDGVAVELAAVQALDDDDRPNAEAAVKRAVHALDEILEPGRPVGDKFRRVYEVEVGRAETDAQPPAYVALARRCLTFWLRELNAALAEEAAVRDATQ